jgi:radical SAM superfamily enzyme YgiQ (UPF0313 family)
MNNRAPKTFHFIMIKPSHYDDEGYVIQWWRSSIPSNTLAVLYGLAADCARRKVLGEDVDIRLSAQDETNTRIHVERLAKQIKQDGGHGLVALVGVQTNQYPRAMDLARRFRKHDIQVCIGGFHVSGCIAMLPDIQPDLQEAMDLGVSLFAGELEGRAEMLLKDAYAKSLKPLYNFIEDLPGLDGTPVPHLPALLIRRMSGARTSFDAGRGCPFLCSFCTIINVQGRKSRHRSADDVEEIIRANIAQGVHKFFITDDNFARNKEWESIFDRMIQLRKAEGLTLTATIQVDTVCHKIPRFIQKAGRAGVERVFIGLESINPDSLKDARKGQNNITEYRIMLQAWHNVGALIFAGYIIGFPNDTPESIERDIQIIKRELPVDLLEFFILTPLPGSKDHRKLYEKGVSIDPDMNNYDIMHVTAPHPKMSKAEWQGAYLRAWEVYYTLEHVETVIRRSVEWNFNPIKMMWMMLSFDATMRIEKLHPLEGGLFRRKHRLDRRSSMPVEHPLLFYLRYTWEILKKHVQFAVRYWGYRRCYRRALKTAFHTGNQDIGMMPVQDRELEELELFTTTEAAREAVIKRNKKKLFANT